VRAEHDGNFFVFCFDYALVCTGKLWSPFIPRAYELFYSSSLPFSSPPANSSFPYTIHSRQYRNSSPFANQTVLIVGIGNSALDIALELSQDPTITPLISCRRGTSVVPVSSPSGDPLDTKLATRFFQYTLNNPLRMLYLSYIIGSCNSTFSKNGLPEPPTGLFGPESPIANLKQAEAFLAQLNKGRIKLIGDVKIKKSQCGYFFEEVPHESFPPPPGPYKFRPQSVILCTGYDMGLKNFLSPQIQKEIIQIGEWSSPPPSPASSSASSPTSSPPQTRKISWLKLYRHVLHPTDPTLFFLGFVTSFGNETCIGEMQSRWVTAMIAGLIQFPDEARINNDITKLENYLKKSKPSVAGFVRYIPYMDELAKDLDAVPNVSFFSDPWLYFKVWLGAVVPTQYRLNGIDTHPQARQILAHL